MGAAHGAAGGAPADGDGGSPPAVPVPLPCWGTRDDGGDDDGGDAGARSPPPAPSRPHSHHPPRPPRASGPWGPFPPPWLWQWGVLVPSGVPPPGRRHPPHHLSGGRLGLPPPPCCRAGGRPSGLDVRPHRGPGRHRRHPATLLLTSPVGTPTSPPPPGTPPVPPTLPGTPQEGSGGPRDGGGCDGDPWGWRGSPVSPVQGPCGPNSGSPQSPAQGPTWGGHVGPPPRPGTRVPRIESPRLRVPQGPGTGRPSWVPAWLARRPPGLGWGPQCPQYRVPSIPSSGSPRPQHRVAIAGPRTAGTVSPQPSTGSAWLVHPSVACPLCHHGPRAEQPRWVPSIPGVLGQGPEHLQHGVPTDLAQGAHVGSPRSWYRCPQGPITGTPAHPQPGIPSVPSLASPVSPARCPQCPTAERPRWAPNVPSPGSPTVPGGVS